MNKAILVNGEPVDYSFNSGLPESAAGSMKRYIEHGIEPGSFLMAVLRNDLKSACECADSENRHLLFEYVQWLYNYAPQRCWGSREEVAEWIEQYDKEIEEKMGLAR